MRWFRRLASRAILDELGAQNVNGKLPEGRPETVDPQLVAWAIQVAARRVPWRSDCLVQAMAATQWLRRHGHEPSLQLGIRSAQGTLQGHAWLLLQGRVIVGGDERLLERFVPLAVLSRGAEELSRR
jgi:hypothetical protein